MAVTVTPRERLRAVIETLERCAGELHAVKAGYPEAALDLADLAERIEELVDSLGAIYGEMPAGETP